MSTEVLPSWIGADPGPYGVVSKGDNVAYANMDGTIALIHKITGTGAINLSGFTPQTTQKYTGSDGTVYLLLTFTPAQAAALNPMYSPTPAAGPTGVAGDTTTGATGGETGATATDGATGTPTPDYIPGATPTPEIPAGGGFTNFGPLTTNSNGTVTSPLNSQLHAMYPSSSLSDAQTQYANDYANAMAAAASGTTISPSELANQNASTQDSGANAAAGITPANSDAAASALASRNLTTARAFGLTPTQPQAAPKVEYPRDTAYQFFFTENYQQLPKLRLAPDLLVYINRMRTITTWVGDTFDLNDWLVSANGGSGMDRQHMCTLTFYLPRHLETYFIGLGGRFVIRPFHEVEIYAKGRFLVNGTDPSVTSDAELYGDFIDPSDPDLPTARYYRIYWGFISSLTSDWIEGDYQYTIQCAPMLKLFELTHMRQCTTIASPSGHAEQNVWANIGNLGNPLDIILAVYNKEVTVDQEFSATMDISPSNIAPSIDGVDASQNQNFNKLASRSLMIWQNRMDEIKKRTTFYGLQYTDPVSGKVYKDKINFWNLLNRGDDLNRKSRGTQSQGKEIPLSNVPVTVGTIGSLDPIDGSFTSKAQGYSLTLQDFVIANFHPYFAMSNLSLFHFDENMKRIDALSQMADIMGYEFYQDLNGNVIFKPPFYNMDTRPDAVFNINDVDILSEQLIEDENGIKVTNMMVMGGFAGAFVPGTEPTRPNAQWIDLRNIAKYGQRFKKIELPMLQRPHEMFAYGVICTSRENRFATQINIQIPARPELLLGFPVYLQGRDCFGYLERIQWSYTAANDFTFQLQLSSIRRRIYINKDRLAQLYNGARKAPTLTETTTTQPKGGEKTDSNAGKSPAAQADQIKGTPTVSGLYSGLVAQAKSFLGIQMDPQTKLGTGSDVVQTIIDYENTLLGTTTINDANWCVAFILYCISLVSQANGNAPSSFHGPTSSGTPLLPSSLSQIGVGWVALWQIPGTSHYHVDIVSQIDGETFSTIDGAATVGGNPPIPGVREYSGKSISTKGSKGSVLMGFFDPWNGQGKSVPVKAAAAPKQTIKGDLWQMGITSDKGSIGKRKDQRREIKDLVPLPNAAIQTYVPPIADSSTPQSGMAADSRDAATLARVKQPQIDAAQKVYQDALETSNTAATDAKILTTAINALVAMAKLWKANAANGSIYSYAQNDPNNWLFLDTAPPPSIPLLPSSFSDPINLLQFINRVLPDLDLLGHADLAASLISSHDAKLAAVNVWQAASIFTTFSAKAAVDSAQSTYLQYFNQAIQWMAGDANEILTAATTALTSSPEIVKANQAALAVQEAKAKLATLQGGSDNSTMSNNTSPEVNPALINNNEIDDVLDSDPDNQIYAFGQDTFRTPSSMYGIDDALIKIETAKQEKLNATSFLRPNTFNPYKIVIDERMLGPLSTYTKTQQDLTLPVVQSPDNTYGTPNATVAVGTGGANATAVNNQITSANSSIETATNAMESVSGQFTSAQQSLTQAQNKLKQNQSGLTSLVRKFTDDIRKAFTLSQATTLYQSSNVMVMSTSSTGDTNSSFALNAPSDLLGLIKTLTTDQTTYFKRVNPQVVNSYLSAVSTASNYRDVLLSYVQLIWSETFQMMDNWGMYNTFTQNVSSAQLDIIKYQAEVTFCNLQINGFKSAISGANRKVKALTKGTSGNTGNGDLGTTATGQKILPMTPAEYLARLCIEQPYTDANGFEQIVGFPWGRTMDVNGVATALRMDATAQQFTDMTPVVPLESKSMTNQSGLLTAPNATIIGGGSTSAKANGTDASGVSNITPASVLVPAVSVAPGFTQGSVASLQDLPYITPSSPVTQGVGLVGRASYGDNKISSMKDIPEEAAPGTYVPGNRIKRSGPQTVITDKF